MKKSYYAIIPANVRYDPSLTDGAKLLYGEITALCNEKGYCWASDTYFMDLYKVSRSTIQRWFHQLESKGYIKRVIKYKDGTKEIEQRYTYLCDNPMLKNETTPMPKNETDNITGINNTFKKYIVEIVNYLNDVAGKTFRHTTRKTQTLIKARLKEGFTVDDFKRVIDNKTKEWKHDPKMSKYLRPETLFGTKFESYLNETPVEQNTTRKAARF